MEEVCLWVVFGQTVPWTFFEAEQLRGRVEEVYQLRNDEPVTDDRDLTYILDYLPKMAAIARTMPAK